MEPSWPSWGHLGAVLGLSWAIFGHLGASWGPLGAILGHLGASWGPPEVLGAFWGLPKTPEAFQCVLGLPGAFWRFLAWGRPGLQRAREPYENTCFFHMPTHGEPEEKRPAVRQPTESRHFHVTFQRQLAQSTPPRFPFHCQAGSHQLF